MLGYEIPSHHIFWAINIPNSEVEQLHKFEQALPLPPPRTMCLASNVFRHTDRMLNADARSGRCKASECPQT